MTRHSSERPPAFFLRLLHWFCPAHLLEEIEGDLIQRFHRDAKALGIRKAKQRLIWNIIRFFRPGVILRNRINFHINRNLMLSHYLKVALRTTGRNKGFSAINFTGLSLGITCTVLIMLWVQNELSYDRFHPDGERLFEAWNRENLDDGVRCWNTTPRILAPTMTDEYPEVEHAVSFADYQMEFLVTKEDTKFTDASGVITSTQFLSMFNFPLLAGETRTALDDPFSIVVTQQFAARVFGTEPALGKTINFNYAGQTLDFKVTGVMKDLPNNTQLDFGYLLSWELMRATGETDNFWGNNSLRTFVKLKAGASVDTFNKKIRDIAIRHSGGEMQNEVFLYPVGQLRLYSRFVNGVQHGGRIEVVRLFEVIAVLILLISCINFMNLTTARCESRAREVGVRKTVGAPHRTLIAQFLTESFMTAIISAAIALGAIHLLLPTFNTLTEKQLAIDYSDFRYWIAVGGVTLFAGLFAGSYPSFFLSSFKPIKVLKGNYISSLSGASVRRALVIFQFSFTIILVMATLVVRNQINFAQQRETGFLKDNLIYHTLNADLTRNYTAFRDELLRSGLATSISKTFSPITEQWSATHYLEWQGKDPGNQIIFDRYSTDEDLVATAGLELVAGRDLDLSQFPSDSSSALINETAARVMNFGDPVGESFKDSGKEWKIVGVFKDFIARSPYQKVAPMVIEGARTGWFYT
ncbi:MAG: ABC transporter permease, partial [Bacteroidota bacterium]|nr:ABC transporter permease [Bacteroidota bacterium]